MNQLKFPRLLLVFLMMNFLNCKKESTDPGDKPNSREPGIYIEKSNYNQYEIAQAYIIDIPLNFEKINGTLTGGVAIELSRVDSSLIFLVPKECLGNVSLSFKISERDYTLSFVVSKAKEISDPDVVIQRGLTDIRSSINEMETGIGILQSTQAIDFQSDINSLKAWLSDLENKYNALTPEEKLLNAHIFDANEIWIAEFRSTVDNLKVSGKSLKKAPIDDWEKKVDSYMEDYPKAVIEAVKHLPKIAFMIAAGSIFGPVGAAIGAGIAIGNFISDLQKVHIEGERLYNHSVLPFESPYISQKKSVEFENGNMNDLLVKIKYRSIYKADVNSLIGFVKTFVRSAGTANTLWDDLKAKLSFLNLKFSLTDINSIDAFKSELRQVHSNYLQIKIINNSKVNVKVDKNEGYLNAVFSATGSFDEPFQFQLAYAHKDISLNSEIKAVLKNNNPIYGTWAAQTIQGKPFGTDIHNYCSVECPELICETVNYAKSEITFNKESVHYFALFNKWVGYDYLDLKPDCTYSSVKKSETNNGTWEESFESFYKNGKIFLKINPPAWDTLSYQFIDQNTIDFDGEIYKRK